MNAEEFFTTQWPAVAGNVGRLLARAGAPSRDQDDLVQETALRLFGMWSSVDPERPVEPLARRIAVNALRDQWRRRSSHELLGGIPDQASAADTERAALARVELREVARALDTLRPSTAATLRAAVCDAEGGADDSAPTSAAVRMARSRARKQLTVCVSAPSGTVAA